MSYAAPLNRSNRWNPKLFEMLPFRYLTIGNVLSQFNQWPSLEALNGLLIDLSVKNQNGKQIVAVPAPRQKPPRPYNTYEVFYEPRIFLTGEIYTRTEHWHDLLNLCIWATFPLSKAALNCRHYEAFRLANPLPFSKLANRNKEQDLLTIFDEGGSMIVRDSKTSDLNRAVLFGHGAYECLVYEKLDFGSVALEIDLQTSHNMSEPELLAKIDAEAAILLQNRSMLMPEIATNLRNITANTFLVENLLP